MQTAIIVPARIGSTRFRRKLLHPVLGKPVLLWTADRLREQAPEFPLYFAVDSDELREPLEAAGYKTIMTPSELPSGTDRLAVANEEIGADYVINVQGDEPLTTGEQVRTLERLLAEGADMATLVVPMTSAEDYHDPNHVKVVVARNKQALYFSRASIPFMRDAGGSYDASLGHGSVYHHLGMYAYTASFLKEFARLEPGKLEQLERLEMLRALENGFKILVDVSSGKLIEIDTPEQAEEFEAYLRSKGIQG